MKRRFYFTTYNDDGNDDGYDGEIGYDYIGNIRGARTYAKKLANEICQDIFINDFESEDILDVIYPDNDDDLKLL